MKVTKQTNGSLALDAICNTMDTSLRNQDVQNHSEIMCIARYRQGSAKHTSNKLQRNSLSGLLNAQKMK